MFEKILLPSDGSRSSIEAAKVAAHLALTHGGGVHPVVAVEYQFVQGEDVPPEISQAITNRIRSRAQRALDETSEAIRQVGGHVEDGKIVEGAPVDVILNEAEEGEFDLIVMGSRGVSLDCGEDRLVGSVTERVLNKAPCPVLVIRAEPKP